MEDTLASGGITGLLTMSLLWAFRFYENRKAKANGGTVYDNVKVVHNELRDTGTRVSVIEEKVSRIESDISDLNIKMKDTHRDLMEFQQKFMEYLKFQEGIEHARRHKD